MDISWKNKGALRDAKRRGIKARALPLIYSCLIPWAKDSFAVSKDWQSSFQPTATQVDGLTRNSVLFTLVQDERTLAPSYPAVNRWSRDEIDPTRSYQAAFREAGVARVWDHCRRCLICSSMVLDNGTIRADV
jgi:hypothetical protein